MDWAILSIPVEFRRSEGGSVVSRAMQNIKDIMADTSIPSTPIIRTRPSPATSMQSAIPSMTRMALPTTQTTVLRRGF
jgi:hypothetical protein